MSKVNQNTHGKQDSSALSIAKRGEPDIGINTLAKRLPASIEIGQTVYLQLAKGAHIQAEKVTAIIIRETTIGIVLQSGREVNADDVGKYLFLEEGMS